jgi:hypothetical protein
MFGLGAYDGVGRGDVVPKEKRTGWSSAAQVVLRH